MAALVNSKINIFHSDGDFDAVVQDFDVFLTEHLVVGCFGDDVWEHFFAKPMSGHIKFKNQRICPKWF